MKDEDANKLVQEKIEEQKKLDLPNQEARDNDVKIDEVNMPSTEGLIKQAEEAAQRLKEENDRREQIILSERELQARRVLGGRTEAGYAEPQKTEAELRKEAANKFLEGTGLNIR